MEEIVNAPGKIILELGCGTARLSAKMAGGGAVVVPVDSEMSVQTAQALPLFLGLPKAAQSDRQRVFLSDSHSL